ncbi:NAD(P)H-binding protein [Nocardioides sp. SYSU D00038]|uniref:NAD(P)H-binding protein n=1 Tax=Nocardioides sp. SYSU D00038 TaxID=2812554 RepID=UPI001966E71B|nr:NAD(P)H-binding protein [Nocardioides sp. SYSU D00038]
MEILLTGGTGHIGSAVLVRLLAVGHEVTAVVRSDDAAAAVKELGAQPLVGDVFDTDWLRGQLETVQGAIHTAAGGDERDATLNESVVSAALAAFAGTDKPFVHTGGIWTYGNNSDITEDSPADPIPLTAWRLADEERVLAADLRGSVIRPAVVYGGGTGIPSLIAGSPRDESGALRLIGTGEQHWTTVHRDELADLYLRVLDQPTGDLYVGANGTNPTVRELGEALGPVVPGSAEEAAERVGAPFAEALLLDQQASGAKARELGWQPSAPSLVNLLARGYSDAS